MVCQPAGQNIRFLKCASAAERVRERKVLPDFTDVFPADKAPGTGGDIAGRVEIGLDAGKKKAAGFNVVGNEIKCPV
jgi:hypothetical protein